jgi:hypothetical protein
MPWRGMGERESTQEMKRREEKKREGVADAQIWFASTMDKYQHKEVVQCGGGFCLLRSPSFQRRPLATCKWHYTGWQWHKTWTMQSTVKADRDAREGSTDVYRVSARYRDT